MRLMLGTKDCPSLLVNIHQEYSSTHFDFYVVNGCWYGTYYNGYITIHDCPGGDYSSLEKVEILSDNQDRLRCGGWNGEYQDVFNNFHDPNYVAPKHESVIFDDMDDISF